MISIPSHCISASISLPLHPPSQIIKPTLRILQTVPTPLHMLPFKASQTLHDDVDQAFRVVGRVVAAALPPHRAAEAKLFDVLDFLGGDLRTVVGDHGAAGGVVAP